AEREQRERQAAAHREEQQRREAQREQRERQARAEQAERERAALLAAGPPVEKLPEDQARHVVHTAFTAGLPVRSAAELTGWSVGWVSTRYQEHRETAEQTAPVLEGAAQ
ncbi:DUF2637 domain-containing protein, partial [Streptomyces bambusae]|nr:DUF2637 domain-containing protein [Streptomyces bambusae]